MRLLGLDDVHERTNGSKGIDHLSAGRRQRLTGRVEVDDAYLGGERPAASAAAVPPARRRSSPRSRPRPRASQCA